MLVFFEEFNQSPKDSQCSYLILDSTLDRFVVAPGMALL